MTKITRMLPLVLVAAALSLAAPNRVVAQNPTITDLVVQNDNFSTLETAVTRANLASTLSGTGPFTVFAPTDAAFSKLPQGALQQLLDNPDRLTNALQYHVVSGRLTADELQGRDYVTTLTGERLPVRMMNGQLMVGGAMVEMANVEASNGIVHGVNEVLMPPMQVRKGM